MQSASASARLQVVRDAEDVLAAQYEIPVLLRNTLQEIARAGAAGQHPVVELDDQQRDPANPRCVLREDFLLESLDIHLDNEWNVIRVSGIVQNRANGKQAQTP